MTRWELFWKNLFLTFRRAPHDPDARRRLLFFLVLPLWVALELILLAATLTEPFAWFEYSMILICTPIALWLLRRSFRGADSSFLDLTGKRRQPIVDTEFDRHRPALKAELLRVAILVDRACCEGMHRSKLLPEEYRGVSRRRTLDLARREDLWPGFTLEEQDLLIASEESWTEEQISSTVLRAEEVRVLRFALGLDAILTPFEFLQPDLQCALELTANPGKAEGTACLGPSDLRTAQGAAQRTFACCVVESETRGLMNLPPKEMIAWRRMRVSHDGTEVLIDGVAVAQANPDTLQWVTQAAYRRIRTFELSIAFLYEPIGGEAEFRLSGAQFTLE